MEPSNNYQNKTNLYFSNTNEINREEKFQPRDPQFISKENLINLQNYLIKFTTHEFPASIPINGIEYKLWYDSKNHSVNFQEDNDFSESAISSLRLTEEGKMLMLNGRPLNELSEKFEDWLEWQEACLQVACEHFQKIDTIITDSLNFSKKDYIDLERCLMKHRMNLKVDNKEYVIFYSKNNKILNIQDRSSYIQKKQDGIVTIKIDEMEKISVMLNNIPVTPLSIYNNKEFLQMVKMAKLCFSKAIEKLQRHYGTAPDLNCLKSLLKKCYPKKILLEINKQKYEAFYNQNAKTITIQNTQKNEEKIEFTIGKEGKVTPVSITKSLLPEYYKRVIKQFSKAGLLYSSDYRKSQFQDFIFISTVFRSIKRIPEFHLKKIGNLLKMIRYYPKIKVNFLNNNLKPGIGLDAGGLSRDYVSELGEAIKYCKTLSLSLVKASNLYLPQTKKHYEMRKPVPSLDEKENRLFESLGSLMALCLTDGTCTIGKQFDKALFNGIKVLSEIDLNTPFDKLSLDTKLKVAEALLLARDDCEKFYLERIDLLRRFDSLTDEELKIAAMHIGNIDGVLEESEYSKWFGNDDEAKLELIKQKKEEFKQLLIDAVFSPKTEFGGLGRQIAAIHAIARGINTNFITWPKIETSDCNTIEECIQGSLNREEIAKNTVYKGSDLPIKRKLKWLRNWLKNEASKQELKQFLKFVTGSTALPKGKKIEVVGQSVYNHGPLPEASTCFFQLKLAPLSAKMGVLSDETEAGFITCLKTAIKQEGYQFR